MANKTAASCNNQYLKISENLIKTVTAIEIVRLKATSTQSHARIIYIYMILAWDCSSNTVSASDLMVSALIYHTAYPGLAKG